MRGKRAALWTFFLLYLIILIWLLFFDSFYNRSGFKTDFHTYFELKTNFIPFATISRYIRNLSNHIQSGSAIVNIFGNIAAFMPMGIFLPILFRQMRKAWIFIPLIFVVLAGVEGLQLLLRVGSCDIDDVILNLFGALIVYFLIKLPPIKKRMKHLN